MTTTTTTTNGGQHFDYYLVDIFLTVVVDVAMTQPVMDSIDVTIATITNLPSAHVPSANPLSVEVLQPILEDLGRQTWRQKADAQLQTVFNDEQHHHLTRWLIAGLSTMGTLFIVTIVAVVTCRFKKCNDCCLFRGLRFLRRQQRIEIDLPSPSPDIQLRRHHHPLTLDDQVQ